MGTEQQSLWHDSLEEAIRSAVDVLGGPKRVGGDLWPSRRLHEAARLLNHSLDPDRAEKLALAELELIGRMAREAGCHTIATYLMRTWGYQDPQPVEPVDELAELQRAFMASVDQQKQILQRLEQLQSIAGPELTLVRKSGRAPS